MVDNIATVCYTDCIMKAQKKQTDVSFSPKLGESGFEVEWCSKLPKTDWGDADFDQATYEFKRFRSKADAWAFATTVYPTDCLGAVRVVPFVYQPFEESKWTGDFEYGESEFYEGED